MTSVADATVSTVAVTDVTGDEDSTIPLDIGVALADADGSESITNITISGVPAGAQLSAGTDNGDGTWTLLPGNLPGLTIDPLADSADDFVLTVSATSTDTDGDSATTVPTLNVTVTGVADVPTAGESVQVPSRLSVPAESVAPDGTPAMVMLVMLSEPSTSVRATLMSSGIAVSSPPTASVTVTAGASATAVAVTFRLAICEAVPPSASVEVAGSTGEMEVVVSKADLLSLPGVSSVDFDGGMVVSADGTLYAVSDGDRDTIFAIDTATGVPAVVASGDPFQDLDAFVTLAPNGDLIVADDKTDTVYRVDTGDGSVSTFLSKEQIEAVAGDGVDLEGGIAFDVDGNFYLADEKTDGILKWPADDPDAGTINPDAGEVFVTDASISAVTGEEADLEAGIFFGTDGSASFESLEITISDVPDGATLSAGTDNGDGSWTLTPAQLTGLTVTPPTDSDADFTLTVTAAATEAEDGEAVTVRTLDVTVTGVADQPTVTVADVTGGEDSAIALDIGVAFNELDGSVSITDITVSGVPSGTELSAGTDNLDGTWTMTPAQLTGLTVTPPDDSDADFILTVSATSTEAEGDTATTVASLDVTVTGVADVPTVTVADATGAEDQAISLDIDVALNDIDGSETITDITVSGVLSGAQLSAGTDNLDGTWTLTPADLAGLTVTPPADSDADFTLTVSATSTEADGDAATTLANLDVPVTGVADVPTVDVVAASGGEDQAIALDIGVALGDVDGSETITDITISGVPSGAQLSAGTDNLDGTWTLTPADLAGLTITPAADSDADFTLTVSTTSTEAEGDAATTLANLDVTVTGVVDVPSVTVADAAGAEDIAIALDIGVALGDIDGSESITDITVSGVPTGAELSAGTDNLDGTWTLTPADLAGLTITPPADSDADFSELKIDFLKARGCQLSPSSCAPRASAQPVRFA